MTRNETTNLKLKTLQAVCKLRAMLPKAYVKAFIDAHPHYDSHAGSQKITNVFSGRSTDETVLVDLENFIEKLRA